MITPTINVNLKPCTCSPRAARFLRHAPGCEAPEVRIPCPIPRTVVMEVRLGECACVHAYRRINAHRSDCPARPIRVTCTISGNTWPESQAIDGMRVGAIGREYHIPTDDLIQAACRQRWALVKALVLGRDEEWRKDPKSEGWNLQPQRDAVFAALADMARCERAYWEAAKAIYVAFPRAYVSSDMQVVDPGDDDGETPSARWLTAYVQHLITEIGAMP